LRKALGRSQLPSGDMPIRDDRRGELKAELSRGARHMIIRERTGESTSASRADAAPSPTAPFAARGSIRHDALHRPRSSASPTSVQGRGASAASAHHVDKPTCSRPLVWKDVVTEVPPVSPNVALDQITSTTRMQWLRAPKKFDVVVTGNMFGDIPIREAALITG